MKNFFESGNGFFAVSGLFFVVSVLSERSAVYLAIAVVFFILGLAARKKSIQKDRENPPST